MRQFLFSIPLLIIIFSFSKSESKISTQRKDFEVYVEMLSKKEGVLDLHIAIDSIQQLFTQLNNRLATEQTPMELFKLYSSTTAKIQCGHTQLQPTKKVIKEWVQQRNSLPIDYVLVGQKLFTTKIVNEDKKILNYGKSEIQQKATIPPNCEVYSINNLTIKEMMNDISEYISSDENGIEFKYFQASHLFEFYRQITYPIRQDSTAVVYISKKDTIQTFLYNGFPPIKTINKRLSVLEDLTNKNNNNIGKFSIYKAKYGLFKFVSFKNCKGKSYEKFLEESFKSLTKKKIKNLIVDLRGNTGGITQYAFMRYIVGPNIKLGKYQITKPKKGFENIHLKKFNGEYRNHRLLTLIQKLNTKLNKNSEGLIYTKAVDEKLIFKGKIVVITDEGSFSASSILASNLKTLAKAKIAGHTAGGSFYKGNAGTLTCILPRSKFALIVNPNTFWTQLEHNDDSQSIKIPDLIVDPIYPDSKRKDDWYINKVVKLFK